MAILNDLLVNGVSRFLQTVYVKDINVSDQLTVSNLSADHISVGYNHDSYALSANTFICNSWIRTNGATGWFSQSYGGGWYMTDTNYIKNYAGKSLLLVSNGGANPSAPSQTGLYLGSTGNYYFRQDGSIRASNFVSPEAKVNTFNATDIIASNSIESPRWIVSSVANLGGRFIVAPTLYFTSSATITVSNITSTTIDLVITDTSSDSPFNGITSENKIAGISWFQGAQVKFSGEINGVGFGSAEGTVLTQMTTSNKRIQLRITTSKGSGLSATSYTGSQIDSIAVMLYKTPVSNNGSTLYPVGIYLSSYGDSRQSFIDIYGGTSENPHARIGQLSGLKDASTNQLVKINGVNADGWGIFTDQGHFTGFINATSGVMGGWTISDDRIYHTANTPSSTATVLSPGGVSSSTAIGGSSGTNTWAFTIKNIFGVTTAGALYSSSGKIGGWTIGASSLYNVTNSLTSTSAGMYLGTDGVRNYKDANTYVNITGGVITAKAVDLTGKITATSGKIGKFDITTTYLATGSGSTMAGMGGNQAFWAGSESSNGAPFRVGYDGTFVATSATVTGSVTATSGEIGGFQIDSTSIRTKNVAVTSNADNSISLSSADFKRTVAGAERTGLRFAIGDKFGVTGDGAIYASSATITGTITATSGTIGGITANSSYGLYTNSKTSATSTNTGFYISKDGAIYLGAYNSTAGACPFQVTAAGALTATSANISGTLIAGSNSKIGPWSVTSNAIYKGSDIFFPASYFQNYWQAPSSDTDIYFGDYGLSFGSNLAIGYDGTMFSILETSDIVSYLQIVNGGLVLVHNADDTERAEVSINGGQVRAEYQNASSVFDATGIALYNGNTPYFSVVAENTEINKLTVTNTVSFGAYGKLVSNSNGNTGIQRNDVWSVYEDTNGTVHIPHVLVTENYDGTNRRPVGTVASTENGVSHLRSTSTQLQVYAYWGTPNTIATKNINISSSDIRLKENIKETQKSGLDLINKIHMYSFDWKDDHRHQSLGFVADYLEKLDPHLSVGGGNDEDGIPVYKSVDTFYLQGYEVRAIQELSKENEELKKRISRLEEIINGR